MREDPNHRGLLVLGTDNGLYYSPDDGANWTPLKSGFPPTPVYDLKFEKRSHDLVVATHGRGLFILDDITPLEQFTTEVQNSDMHLFDVTPTHLWNMFSRYGRAAGWAAPNRPVGALVSYYFKQSVEGRRGGEGERPALPVTIVITSSSGETVRTLHGAGHAGVNRVAWDLKWDPPTALRTGREDAGGEASEGSEEFRPTGGPVVLPGTYKITVTAGGRSESRTVEIGPDPRFAFDQTAAQAQLRAALELRDEISALHQALNRNNQLRAQIKSMRAIFANSEQPESVRYTKLLDGAQQLDVKLSKWQEGIYNPAVQNDPKYYLHYLARLNDHLLRVLGDINEDYNRAPTEEQMSEIAAARAKVDDQVRTFNALLSDDVTKFNKLAADTGASTLYAGPAIAVRGEQSQNQTSGGGQ
jgi:hypothetical protein